MGYSFTNLQIRCADRFDPDEIARLTACEGWEPVDDADQADVSTAVYTLANSPWVTVRSDAFEEDADALIEAAKRISQALGADALAIYCFDSDYMFLNLVNPGKKLDLWANGGSTAALGMTGVRRSNFRAWKDHVTSVDDFRKAMKESRVFEEECLYDLEGVLSLPPAQSLGGIGNIPDDIKVHWYYYRASAPRAQGEPPSLSFRYPMSYCALDGQEYLFSVYNYGGPTVGMTVIIEGVESVENAKIQTLDRKGHWVLTPADFHSLVREDGTRALRALLFDLPLPAIDRNLPPRKLQKVEFERGVILRFIPRNGHEGQLLTDMRLTMIPMVEDVGESRPDLRLRVLKEYTQGQCTWQGRIPPEDDLERMQRDFVRIKDIRRF